MGEIDQERRSTHNFNVLPELGNYIFYVYMTINSSPKITMQMLGMSWDLFGKILFLFCF